MTTDITTHVIFEMQCEMHFSTPFNVTSCIAAWISELFDTLFHLAGICNVCWLPGCWIAKFQEVGNFPLTQLQFPVCFHMGTTYEALKRMTNHSNVVTLSCLVFAKISNILFRRRRMSHYCAIHLRNLHFSCNLVLCSKSSLLECIHTHKLVSKLEQVTQMKQMWC